jgi:hypothetical protein
MGNAVVHWELMSKEPANTGTKEGINGGIVKPEREGPSRCRAWASSRSSPTPRAA